MVREGLYLGSFALNDRARGGNNTIPAQPLADTMAVAIAIDAPDTIRFVTSDDLARWGVSFDDALALAKRNLMARGVPAFDRILVAEGSSAIAATAGEYATSWLLFPEILASLGLDGPPVVVLHDTDQLTVTGAHDAVALAVLGRWSEERASKGELSPGLVTWHAAAWRDFTPQVEDTRRAFARLRAAYLRVVYDAQEDLLASAYANEGRDVYVPQCETLVDPDDGEVVSFTVWVADIDTALPRCDVVVFADGLGEDANVVGYAAWSQVARQLDGYLRPLGLIPERYALRGFPSDAQLDALGLESGTPRPAKVRQGAR